MNIEKKAGKKPIFFWGTVFAAVRYVCLLDPCAPCVACAGTLGCFLLAFAEGAGSVLGLHVGPQ